MHIFYTLTWTYFPNRRRRQILSCFWQQQPRDWPQKLCLFPLAKFMHRHETSLSTYVLYINVQRFKCSTKYNVTTKSYTTSGNVQFRIINTYWVVFVTVHLWPLKGWPCHWTAPKRSPFQPFLSLTRSNFCWQIILD